MTINRVDQCCRLPVPVRNQVSDSLITRTPAIATRHVRFGTGLVQKHEPADIQPTLLLLPAYPSFFDVTSLLLAGMQRLFLCVCPCRRSSTQIVFKQQSTCSFERRRLSRALQKPTNDTQQGRIFARILGEIVMSRNLATLGTLLAVSIANCHQANAQLFRNARQNRQIQTTQKGQASLDYVPLTRFGRAIKSRGDSRVHRVAERRGVSAAFLRGRRLQGLENAGAALDGVGSGVGEAASSIGVGPSSYGSTLRGGSALPANFSQRMRWNDYNRNYSSLPYHRSANRSR